MKCAWTNNSIQKAIKFYDYFTNVLISSVYYQENYNNYFESVINGKKCVKNTTQFAYKLQKLQK